MNRIARYLAWLIIACFGLLGLALFSGCAAKPVRPAAAHMKPSVVPVTKPITVARAGVVRASSSVAEAQDRTAAAAAIAQRLSEAQPANEEAKTIASELAIVQRSLFRAQAELRDTSDRLKEAESRIADLDSALDRQTAELNQVDAERAKAQADNAALIAQLSKANSELAQAKRTIFFGKLKTWGVGIGFVALIVGSFALKLVRPF